MPRGHFKHAKVAGISVVVPDNERKLEERFFNNLKKMERTKKIAGFNTRYLAPKGCTASDLAESAANRLLKDMNIDRNTVDGLVFVVQNPDYPQPSSACVLHGKLGLGKDCAAFDVNHGCAGYIYGLWLASCMVENGMCKRVLLLAGDSLQADESLNNLIVEPVFGNAGSATLVEYSQEEYTSSYVINTDGSKYDVLITPAGGARLPLSKGVTDKLIEDSGGNKWKLDSFFMDGLNVFEFTMAEIPPNIRELMEYAGITDSDVDFYAIHQANKQIVDSISRALSISEDKYSTSTFSTYGNQSAVSIPANIADMLADKLKEGRQRLVLSGFGIGLSWGAAHIVLDDIYLSGIIKEKFDNLPSREEHIAFWTDRIEKR